MIRKMFFAVALVALGLPLSAQKYDAMADKSVVKWTGKKIAYSHWGTVALKQGVFEIKDNKFVSGKFVVDMNAMVCDDIEDAARNTRLIGHLKSDDFFSVETHPEAHLTIKSSTPLKDSKATVEADLTIKGKTHPVTFEVTQSGATFKASVVFDRSNYDVRFGSNKFFDNLGDNAIANEITLDVTVVAMRQK